MLGDKVKSGLPGNVDGSKLAGVSCQREKESVPRIHHGRGCQAHEEGRCRGGLAWPSPQCVQFLVAAPAGEVPIPSFEVDIILPLDAIEKYGPDAVISTLGEGGEVDDKQDDSSEGGYAMEEVAKHNKKGDVWVVLNGPVLNVSNLLSQHPGAVGHTDLCREGCRCRFQHDPLDVVEKKKASRRSHRRRRQWQGRNLSRAAFGDTPGVLLVNVRSYGNACCYLILSIIYEICATTFSANFKISYDRSGPT